MENDQNPKKLVQSLRNWSDFEFFKIWVFGFFLDFGI